MNLLARARCWLCLASAVMLTAAFWLPVHGMPLTYTLMVDTVIDSNAFDHQICTQAANDCSLRGAISFANRNGQNHYVLVLSPGVYLLSLTGAGEDANATGDLDIVTDLIIQGNGASLNANQLDRVLDVHAGNLLLENLIISGGAAPDGPEGLPGSHGGSGAEGGGIRYNASGGTLTLKNCRVEANKAGSGGEGGVGGAAGGTGGVGGGIYGAAQTSILLNLSQVKDNRAGSGGTGGSGEPGSAGGSGGIGGAGGGIFTFGSIVLVDGSISNNRAGAGGDGGAGGAGNPGGGNGGTGGRGGQGGGIDAAVLTARRAMLDFNSAGDGGKGGSGADRGEPAGLPGSGGNGGAGGGGGGVMLSGGALSSTLVNATLYHNTAGNGGSPGAGGASGGAPGTAGDGGGGGGLLNNVTTFFNFVTLTQNIAGRSGTGGPTVAAQGLGGGLANHASLSAMNSIIADNFRAWDESRDDCFTANIGTPLVSHGANLFSTSTGCTITYPDPPDRTDLVRTQAGLLPPAYLGGPTRVVGLTAASPALNLAPCVDWDGTAVGEDQRGFHRPIGMGCDSGAYERMPFSLYYPVILR